MQNRLRLRYIKCYCIPFGRFNGQQSWSNLSSTTAPELNIENCLRNSALARKITFLLEENPSREVVNVLVLFYKNNLKILAIGYTILQKQYDYTLYVSITFVPMELFRWYLNIFNSFPLSHMKYTALYAGYFSNINLIHKRSCNLNIVMFQQ